MKLRIAAFVGAAALGAAALAGPSVADDLFRNKYPSTSATQDCGDGDTVKFEGPLKMWPPNHKMQDVAISATDGPSARPDDGLSNETTLAVMPLVEDAQGGDGGPQHDPDYTPSEISNTGDPTARVDFQLRSERSGKGEGRTYVLDWTADFDGSTNPNGNSCSSMDGEHEPFVVEVPHDMRGGAGWK